ncbi:MAG: YqgE/AlgH family protein [Roseinatronobacter sp.]
MDHLTGKFLIAMPSMPDPRFAHSVVFLCAHSEDGAMGIIVNKPLTDISLKTLLENLELAVAEGDAGLGSPVGDTPIHFGGPVETGRGFVLHSPDFFSAEGSMTVLDGIALSTSVEILAAMAHGQGPSDALIALGYAGWAAGQLEDEIQAGGWLIADATERLLFGTDDHAKWRAALGGLGIDPRHLSGAPGHA